MFMVDFRASHVVFKRCRPSECGVTIDMMVLPEGSWSKVKRSFKSISKWQACWGKNQPPSTSKFLQIQTIFVGSKNARVVALIQFIWSVIWETHTLLPQRVLVINLESISQTFPIWLPKTTSNNHHLMRFAKGFSVPRAAFLRLSFLSFGGRDLIVR